MSSVVPPDSADEALQMLTAAMGYLAAADARAMTGEEQARCLRVIEQVTSAGTVARTSVLAAFSAGQGYSADADYSPRAWLILILSFRVSQGCDLRRLVVDSVADGTLAA